MEEKMETYMAVKKRMKGNKKEEKTSENVGQKIHTIGQ
jgi:hypothetical protein